VLVESYTVIEKTPEEMAEADEVKSSLELEWDMVLVVDPTKEVSSTVTVTVWAELAAENERELALRVN